MVRLTSLLTIGDYQLNFCNEVEIVSSWQNLTDTASITIPRKIFLESKPIVEGNNSIFKIGDKVKIQLGYDFEYDTVFEGYVSDIKVDYPITIQCEDAMWLLKQVSYKKTFRQVTVKELVTYALSKVKTSIQVVYSFPGMQLGKFTICTNSTGAQILEELRKTYGIQSFFREGILYVGFARTQKDINYRKHIPLTFNLSVIENDLIYKNKNNRKVKIKATSILANSDNKQLSVEVGDGDGQTIDVFRYNLSESDLKAYAQSILDNFKYTGFDGTITTFGQPFIRQGDAVDLFDYNIPERNGKYLIKKVTRKYGEGGYRQVLEIDIQVD